MRELVSNVPKKATWPKIVQTVPQLANSSTVFSATQKHNPTKANLMNNQTTKKKNNNLNKNTSKKAIKEKNRRKTARTVSNASKQDIGASSVRIGDCNYF